MFSLRCDLVLMTIQGLCNNYKVCIIYVEKIPNLTKPDPNLANCSGTDTIAKLMGGDTKQHCNHSTYLLHQLYFQGQSSRRLPSVCGILGNPHQSRSAPVSCTFLTTTTKFTSVLSTPTFTLLWHKQISTQQVILTSVPKNPVSGLSLEGDQTEVMWSH